MNTLESVEWLEIFGVKGVNILLLSTTFLISYIIIFCVTYYRHKIRDFVH